MSSKKLTKFSIIAGLSFSAFTQIHAQQNKSAALYQQFQDSIQAKASETSLIKLEMGYLQLNKKKVCQ